MLPIADRARSWSKLFVRLSASLGVLLAVTATQISTSDAKPGGRDIEKDRWHGHSPPLVQVESGVIKGVNDGDTLRFLGIPYAKPPVGELRWANPVKPDRWNGVRDATHYASFCPQVKELGDFAAPSTDEDCLYLNVFAPKHARKRPVMVWLHGGGSVGHSNGHDGSALASEQDVVVVTLNFRLGALGDLVHPALDGEGATTLYELRDQQFALKWVKKNIENFGGDPNNVTLFGESTGGAAVQLQVISPTAKGLFHKAIFQSGPSRYFNRAVPLAEARTRGQAFATAVGCPDQTAECLRSVPVSAILEAQGYFATTCCSTFPIVDGHVLTSSVYDAIRSGQFNKVPFLDVTNRDEYRWFVAFTEISTGHALTPEEYPARLASSFGANAGAVGAAYPLSDFDSPSGALGAAQGDRAYPCQVRNFDIDASKFVRVYAAEFNDPTSPENVFPAVSFPYLASHTHEIPYIFPLWNGASPNPALPLNRQQEKLAREMRKLWATFAEKGALPSNLPPLTRAKQRVISLEIPRVRVISDFSETHRCELWNSIRSWTPVE
ncbi:carboxylesterase/lipase family protein [Peristeroidobacter soli]|uniref:carboxylesterase/lipase family protein n=1 Tax=Peristeroidobacter soli TaxID=2497877 RepID=UPI001FE4337D|nr:carboxylesterase family protein [Peristeroidobacter soli]